MRAITFAVFSFLLCVYFALFAAAVINLLKPRFDRYWAERPDSLLDEAEGKSDSFLSAHDRPQTKP